MRKRIADLLMLSLVAVPIVGQWAAVEGPDWLTRAEDGVGFNFPIVLTCAIFAFMAVFIAVRLDES